MSDSANTYAKYCPNVWVAKCPEKHERGEIIYLTTKYGKENEVTVFNLVFQKDGFFYYSFVRTDGFNYAEHRAARLMGYASTAEAKSDKAWEASNEGKEFLSLGEPIKIGHHSERRHRALIERNRTRMDKAMAEKKKAEEYQHRADFWARKAKDITLANPESLDYYEHLLEKAKARHEGLKNGTIERSHSYSLTYAKKEVNEIEKKIKTARLLWAIPIEYKFRAEGAPDIESFQKAIGKEAFDFKIEPIGLPDVEASFKSYMTLPQIIEVMECIPDSHVMMETILPAEEYTGERILV
ncbi:MAG: DUF3560 domain-containing protein [Polynucleobacter sp.]|nr:MAG: DUF3560 domain-containing protein [Polynucleobacter sp.]